MNITQLRYFVEQMRSTIPDDLHPAGHATINGWLREMRWAAEEGDTATVARRAKHIEAKIEQELQWERKNFARPSNPDSLKYNGNSNDRICNVRLAVPGRRS